MRPRDSVALNHPPASPLACEINRIDRKQRMAATDSRHRIGQDVNTVDQLSSVVILGLAVAGGAAAIVLSLLLIG
ncbi:MAG TPA: hypothetical protein VGU70_07135 [Methylobacterium sp.]|jgi:hypothetical protein|uniref:hypothetical protein n=1 Tax=Methylorubrum sp. B1-46 TaxID=2897334 RepID=UPI001E6570D3|nr:hypothetical protein [Methylorubrum sp. B1-46]UGB28578.1 hypothetical protein LPC10_13205 [Methylorubrum sp. B1-46]HEV2542520.1 hypothetical protein [Methylobacterium sp.]